MKGLAILLLLSGICLAIANEQLESVEVSDISDFSSDLETTESESDSDSDDEEEEEGAHALSECATHEVSLRRAQELADSDSKTHYSNSFQCSVFCPVHLPTCPCNDPAKRKKYNTKVPSVFRLHFIVDLDHKSQTAASKMVAEGLKSLNEAFVDVIKFKGSMSFVNGGRYYGQKKVLVTVDPAVANSYSDVVEYRHFKTKFTGHTLKGYMPIFLINVHGATAKSGTHGWADYPWSSASGSHIFLEIEQAVKNFKRNIVHEMGHALGLYHTFHGEETDKFLKDTCSICHERSICWKGFSNLAPRCKIGTEAINDKRGDMCADTRPTPFQHLTCEGFLMKDKDKCTNKIWGKVATKNYMSYGHLTYCENHFTPCQLQRMRCHLRKFSVLRAYYE